MPDLALADDPVQRFKELVPTLAAASTPEVTPTALEQVIESAGADPAAQQTQLAQHVAAHTPLTVEQAMPVVSAALEGSQGQPPPTTPQAKAAAVSTGVSAATGVTAEVELSQPSMLKPGARVLFAVLLYIMLGLCVYGLLHYSNKSSTSNAGLIALGVAATVVLIGILVLVMGYGNVTIKVGKGGSSAGSSGS